MSMGENELSPSSKGFDTALRPHLILKDMSEQVWNK